MHNTIYSPHYYNRYVKFIESCRVQDSNVTYRESHHILPESLGGSNDESNLINLTARQHYIAHWMLWKAYRGKMTYAFNMMCNRFKHRVTSRVYASIKEDFAKTTSKDQIGRVSEKKGKTLEELYGVERANEIKANARKTHVGMTNKKHSEETLKKMSEAAKNRKKRVFSQEAKDNFSALRSGSKNPRAISVTINGVTYSCKKEALKATGLKYHQLQAMLNASDVSSLQ